jgi:hypothetical protein
MWRYIYTSRYLNLGGECTNSIWAGHCHSQFLFTVTGKLLQKLIILRHRYVWGWQTDRDISTYIETLHFCNRWQMSLIDCINVGDCVVQQYVICPCYSQFTILVICLLRLQLCPSHLAISVIRVLLHNLRTCMFSVTCKNSLSPRYILAANLVCKDVDICRIPITSLKQIL